MTTWTAPSWMAATPSFACSITSERIWRAGSTSVSNSPSAIKPRLPAGICFQSFAGLLIQDAPTGVQAKLRKWGVADYKSIFSRALGLHILFAAAPPREVLSDEFVRSYFRFADQIFQSKQSECDFTPLSSREFHFELYSSGEYSRMLERSWGE